MFALAMSHKSNKGLVENALQVYACFADVNKIMNVRRQRRVPETLEKKEEQYKNDF